MFFSPAVNKQITYGEYVSRNINFSGKNTVFNAFLMPYNRIENNEGIVPLESNLGLKGEYEYIGEAFCDWKIHGLSYEVVQGIVVDTRYLMHHFTGNTTPQIILMANKILSAYEHHRQREAMV